MSGGLPQERIMEKIQNEKGMEPTIAEEAILRGLSAATEQELPQDRIPTILRSRGKSL
jgi:hypothetical protein